MTTIVQSVKPARTWTKRRKSYTTRFAQAPNLNFARWVTSALSRLHFTATVS